jgi:hypothetical protein
MFEAQTKPEVLLTIFRISLVWQHGSNSSIRGISPWALAPFAVVLVVIFKFFPESNAGS